MADKLEFLDMIKSDVDTLVEVQEIVKENYDDLDKDNYSENTSSIKKGLLKEQEILQKLVDDLNGLFGIEPKWYRRGFRIRKRSDDYKIHPPVGIDRTSIEYDLLKKLMTELHKEYFLSGGMIGYMYSSAENHKWEIPNEIPNNAFIRKLRGE